MCVCVFVMHSCVVSHRKKKIENKNISACADKCWSVLHISTIILTIKYSSKFCTHKLLVHCDVMGSNVMYHHIIRVSLAFA